MDRDTLHITNGDVAAGLLRAAGRGGANDLAGEVLPWRDVLHDGPVPGGLALEALSDRRADFLAAAFAGDRAAIRADMAARDATLRRAGDGKAGGYAAVVLWFEHDLYDQLQILQILDALGVDPAVTGRLSLVCIDRFPGVAPFHGLGQLTPDQIATLWPARRPVTAAQVDLARTAWRAFTAPDPTALDALRLGDTGALAFLAPALARLAAEYPWTTNGLPATERDILAAVAAGHSGPVDLFRDHQAREAAPFMGDWSFWARVAGLCAGPAPLLATADGAPFRHPPRDPLEPADPAFRGQALALTSAGRRVLDGRADAVDLNGFDRWIGGVHLAPGTGTPDWRYDPGADRIQRRGT